MSLQRIMSDAAMETIQRHPVDWAKVLRGVRDRLREDSNFALDFKAFTDTPEHVRNDQVEWYFAVQCYVKMLMGDIVACAIAVGGNPLRDEHMPTMNRALQEVLQTPFWANAVRNYDSDGTLGWNEPIETIRYVKTKRSYDAITCKIDPFQAPLEIGYTRGHRSFLHLWQDGALARWCYGDTFIRVFRTLPHVVEAAHEHVAKSLGLGVGLEPLDLDVVKTTVEQMTLW